MVISPYIAWQIGALPLAAVAARSKSHRADSAWWWMAAGFGVSWVADLFGRLGAPVLFSQVYPVLQVGVFVIVLAPRRYVEALVGLLFAALSLSLAWREAAGLDVLLRLVASAVVVWLAHAAHDTLRHALWLYFGVGAVAWLAYVAAPGWPTWLAYQGVRLAGVLWWCVALWQLSNRTEAA